MDREHFEEMQENFIQCEAEGLLEGKHIVLFGHCDATLTLADLLMEHGYRPVAILDNSRQKHGMHHRSIPVKAPEWISEWNGEDSIVLLATRFYEAMTAQLLKLGFNGRIRKLVDYNTYAEYSLSADTIGRKRERIRQGKQILTALGEECPDAFRFYCPFPALGDVYLAMSYLPYFIQRHKIQKYMVCVVGTPCADVVSLFDRCVVKTFCQKDLDAAIQSELYMQNKDFYIVHQDRPYVINLSKALYVKKIPLEDIYCSGIFGLPSDCPGVKPAASHWREYAGLDRIEKGQAVIISPYAKSVTSVPGNVWEQIVQDYTGRGYQIYTNVTAGERPLRNTIAISPRICEMKSVVERAGTFIGIRSGLCDVLRTADCRKIALYPDYNYCDTRWKALDMYALAEFDNIVIGEGFQWESI